MKVYREVVKGCFHCPARITKEGGKYYFEFYCKLKGDAEMIVGLDLNQPHPIFTCTWFPDWCLLEDVEE